jgi:phosphoketolase
MHGVVRQEIIFANHQRAAGREPGWLSVPLVLTSHVWENAKNEQSHQDPAMAEAMMAEPSNVSRVLFVADYNTASAAIHGVYQTQGQVWTLVVPKADVVPDLFTADESGRLLDQGALRLDWAGHDVARQRVVLTAIGAYQLLEVLRASRRLAEKEIAHSVVYMLEPGRFRAPRSGGERAHVAPAALPAELYPDSVPARVFVAHTRPAPLLGGLQPLNTGRQTSALGFVNQGGTLTTAGLLFINRCTWAHVLLEVARVLGLAREDLMSPQELAALDGKASPEGVLI